MDRQHSEDTSAADDCQDKKENKARSINNSGVSDEIELNLKWRIINGSWLLQLESSHPMNEAPGNWNWAATHPVGSPECKITSWCAS
jgi:hypothetical protein